MTNIENLAAVTNDSHGILGHLVWWTISDTQITRDELERSFIRLGIPLDFMPAPIKNHDAFRRASKAIEKKRIEGTNGEHINLLVREVKSSHHEVVRFIVAEYVDSNNVQLRHNSQAARLRLDKKTGVISYVVDEQNPVIEQAIEEFYKLYNLFLFSYDGQALRRLAIDILHTMCPTSARRSGGVYIVPVQYQYELEKLVSLIQTFKNNDHFSEAYMVPLVDNLKNRDLMRERVAITVEQTIAEMANALKGDALTKEEAERLLNDAKSTLKVVGEYEQALKESLGNFSSQVEILQGQMLAALNRL